MMHSNSDDGEMVMARRVELDRMETPTRSGFRRGMSSSNLIGHKLGNLYSLPANSDRIKLLLRELERKLRA